MCAPRGIKWDRQPLGKVSDTVLARKLGVDPNAVFAARRRRGIESAPRRGALGIDWDAQPLGIDTDREIAERLGVTRTQVAYARQYRKIPAADGHDRPSPSVRARAVVLRRKGWKVSDIADALDVATLTVYRWIRKAGVA